MLIQLEFPYIPITILRSGLEITIANPHQNSIIRKLFLLDNQNADLYLALLAFLLIALCFIQLHAFSRPPPVQRKELPRRPALQILFKPDDISSASVLQNNHQQSSNHHQSSSKKNQQRMVDHTILQNQSSESNLGQDLNNNNNYDYDNDNDVYVIQQSHDNDDLSSVGNQSHPENNANCSTTTPTTRKPSIIRPEDLPDSFAPLLSSSQMEIITDDITCNLLHATQVEGSVRLRNGRHEIPLDKDTSRPQLILDIPQSSGCKITFVASIGSDGVSNKDDLDVSKPTKERSLPMVKHAGVKLDPPLALNNVAPTLIHFPTLFEDNVVKYTLRRIQIVRYVLDFIKSMSSLIENMLWIIESKCQIHLGKVSLTPLYKGQQGKTASSSSSNFNEPQWRLSLSFSGHVLLFGYIPIPFVNIRLPTWIIPQPHALLENLLSNQPLASAKLNRELISEQRITIAVLDSVESWDFKVAAVATPPALSADLSLSGGISVAVETMHGTDVSGGRPRGEVEAIGNGMIESTSLETMSTCTMYTDTQQQKSKWTNNRRRRMNRGTLNQSNAKAKVFDANDLVPWKLDLAVKGRIDHDRISVTISKCFASHDPAAVPGGNDTDGSKISFSGSFILCKPEPPCGSPRSSSTKRYKGSTSLLNLTDHSKLQVDNRSVASILLFPKKRQLSSKTLSRKHDMLQYDYQFDVGEDTSLDAVSLSVGASHPMLKGGTIITIILESFFAHGSVAAREDSVIDMSDLSKKRNFLKHLPAIDFKTGIENFFIPEESGSFSDDGQTKCLPELLGGQLMVKVTGGISQPVDQISVGSTSLTLPSSTRNSNNTIFRSNSSDTQFVDDGIKVVVDFAVASLVLSNESNVSEFPELDIFYDQKLKSLLSGTIDGSIGFHLRPQSQNGSSQNVLGKNVFNPLERYEIDFSGSDVFVKIVEANTTLGHRRIIIPSETTFGVKIVESIVDMAFDGTTQCELHWDFQGVSPTLQVTDNVGLNPQEVCHEDRQQVPILISSLRQGRLNLNVSSVGGLTITEAATSRDDRVGLYDWKFFNAFVSPDEHSFDHMLQVLHDKRTMIKILQFVKLINNDLEKILQYALTQIWKAKDIFDKEGVSDPGHAIPTFKMARLMSLFVSGDDSQVDEILPIVCRAVAGEGIDVLAVKELIRKNLSIYDDWAPEIDRALRWAEVMLGSQEAPKPFVETNVSPLAILPKYKNRFVGIPSAKDLYATLLDKRHLPLDLNFSRLVSRVAPYLSFRQIEYILETRPPTDWQPSDIRRLRYVYSIKKKVLDISESYGGLSFMPQSFFVSVFLGEATRASLKVSEEKVEDNMTLQNNFSTGSNMKHVSSTLTELRQRRVISNSSIYQAENIELYENLSPAGRLASQGDLVDFAKKKKSVFRGSKRPGKLRSIVSSSELEEAFLVGDSLLGPEDVAILLQAGLASSMKGSTVVQLNQRMLLDLMASQPRIFAVAVLAEIGTPGGDGNTRGLTSALMALLDLDQSSFTEFHRLDMHELLESWLPGLKIPRREDYLAGGRWARQSYYSAVFGVAQNILEDAEVYLAFKGHIQRVRHNAEKDPIPTAKEINSSSIQNNLSNAESDDNIGISINVSSFSDSSKLTTAIKKAKKKIEEADNEGAKAIESLKETKQTTKECNACASATKQYENAFKACADVLQLDKLSFHADWFKRFYRRNYDALMVKSVYDNVMNGDDEVREWLGKLREASTKNHEGSMEADKNLSFFDEPNQLNEQDLILEIINLIFFDKFERESIRQDPLVRLLISNPPGNYNFTIVSAMGVITEGSKGLELESALKRLKKERNVDTIRADTGTARSFEYNASKIEDAIETAVQLNKPYGLLGYSQGCANSLFCESRLNSGTPLQQSRLTSPNSYLVARCLLFSAANGSMHGPAMEEKIHRLIVMCEQFFKYQQGYCSRAFITFVLETLTNLMDSAAFQKVLIGGGGTFLHQGSRAFWREAQHMPSVPTCVLRGVLEEHTTPESLQMLSNLLTKHASSPLHDSQVHVYDAVGHPIYTLNRNSKIMKMTDMGGSIQRTHHWSPLSEEVKFLETQRDVDHGTFLCAKDRHVYPWVDVNARFGFIKYEDKTSIGNVKEPARSTFVRSDTDNSWISLNQNQAINPTNAVDHAMPILNRRDTDTSSKV